MEESEVIFWFVFYFLFLQGSRCRAVAFNCVSTVHSLFLTLGSAGLFSQQTKIV